MVCRRNFPENVIVAFKNRGYKFNHNEKIYSKTIANRMDISHDFYVKHIMHAVEWKSNSTINKNTALIDKFTRNWRHPLNRKFESYRV